jgi:tetratricopeptide (TPR) repeat protein
MSNLGFIDACGATSPAREAWYERAIAIDPTYPHVHRRLADLFYDRQDCARALEYYRRVLAVLPQYFEVLIQAGTARAFLGDVHGRRCVLRRRGPRASGLLDPAVQPRLPACAERRAGRGARAPRPGRGARSSPAPDLLDANEDLETVRPLPGWPALVDRARKGAEATQG